MKLTLNIPLIKKFLSICIMSICFASCNNDNNNEDIPINNRVFDELAYIQNSLVKLNDDGGFKNRVYGVVLDPADSTEVFVGVEDYEETKRIFTSFFPDTTVISNEGALATLTTRKGSAELIPCDNEDGLIAYAEFNIPGLKYISKMNFILNAAWPENSPAPSECIVGSWYPCDFKTYDGTESKDNFLCIRTAQHGKPALLIFPAKRMTISPLMYLSQRNEYPCLDNFPSVNKLMEIQNIIGGKNWKTFQEYAKGTLFSGEYWTCENEGFGTIFNFEYTVSLPEGIQDSHNCYDKPVAYELYFLEVY